MAYFSNRLIPYASARFLTVRRRPHPTRLRTSSMYARLVGEHLTWIVKIELWVPNILVETLNPRKLPNGGSRVIHCDKQSPSIMVRNGT